MATLGAKLMHAWNAFTDRDAEQPMYSYSIGTSYGHRPDRTRLHVSNERSILSSIYTRIAVDTAAIDIRHVRMDENGRFVEYIDSGLDNCLLVEANLDQAARAFRQDMVLTLFDRGVIGIVPVETSINPSESGGYDIRTLRVGEISQWHPKHVQVSVYNEDIGRREELTLSKRVVAVVENPLAPVMNEPNSTLARLNRKLNLLDNVDEASSSGKLDLIIQLPYVIKSPQRKAQAEQRAADIETQLRTNKYGIAYTDGTEKITQLNRPVENNLWAQVKDLKDQLYAELGLTPEVMNGTADEKTMLNYQNRTVEPILGALAEAMKRTFLTKTARSQRQSIEYFRDPFKLVPMSELAEMADKFTRNEIVSANEFRSFIGMPPSKDPKADELRNSNLHRPADAPTTEQDESGASISDINSKIPNSQTAS